jgi:hypothetical protein
MRRWQVGELDGFDELIVGDLTDGADEIERLRRLLREAADAERDHYATQVSVLMKSGWYKRIRETLGDE